MRALVVYASSYGATKGIAERIADTIRTEGLEVDLASANDSMLFETSSYDAFVIGSAIHAGHWLKPAIEFVRSNRPLLKGAPVWLFSSGPIGEKAVGQPQPDPKEIDEVRDLVDVRDHLVFGGCFDPATADLERVNWLEKQIASHLLPVGDWRNWEDIEAWSRQIGEAIKQDASREQPVLVS
jgi:menaquinone-dependent protoporphyrinogen oxidase